MPASNRAGQCAIALAATLALACRQPTAPADPIDLLVINARVVDGTGAPARTGAVAVHAGHVTAVLDAAGAAAAATRAARVIDARGRVVAPSSTSTHTRTCRL
jgi:adenine deaminase